MPEVVISIYQDQRRKKVNNLYPVKLRVYYDYETRLFQTGISLTKEDFERSYLSQKPRQEYKDLKTKIAGIEAKANSIVKDLKQFDWNKFEKQLLRSTGSGSDVFYHYNQVIEQLNKREQIGTASNYDLSAKSLKHFLKAKGKKADFLQFEMVNTKFLNEYEHWMLQNGKSSTTVGIYLRPLRAIFNTAIEEGEISKEIYPFGKKKYQIPAGQNIKKALTKADLKKLWECNLENEPLLAKARDFFFFSYVINGINIKDIASLRYKNINGDTINFLRAKTINTTKADSRPIIASYSKFAKEIVKRYGNSQVNPNTYIFPIFKEEMSAAEKHKTVQRFTRFLNQHMKRLAKSVGVDESISTYFARHSFATIAVQNGAPLELIQDSLGHANMQTTMNYWKGFGENIKKELGERLTEF